MKLFTKESKKDKKDFKKFISRHSSAYLDWELLHRINNQSLDEVPLDNFLDLIARDDLWYNTFLNNIKIRLTK
jgi:hypothetical protein